MKHCLIIVALVVGSFSFVLAQPKRHLPKEFKKLKLGMSMEEVAKRRPKLDVKQLENDGFRYRWMEYMDPQNPISQVIYCFDDAEEKPLYELVIFYRDLSVRDAWIRKYFGEPNAEKGKEWAFILKKGLGIKAWRYEDRLIVVGLIPGTEWAE